MSKSLKINRAVIKVSNNKFSALGWLAFLEVDGILPNGRKIQRLTATPMHGRIWIKNLYSHNGSADVRPSDWWQVIEGAPVVSCSILPVQMTPELENAARLAVLSVCDCPAVTDTKDVHPDFRIEYTPVENYTFPGVR